MEDNPGSRLVLFREKNGLTQDALAYMLGTSRTAISLIENGQRTPSKAFLLKISDRYGVSADWLLNGQGEMQRALGPGFKGATMRIDPPQPGNPNHHDFLVGEVSYSMIRRMDLSVSAGSGVVALEGQDAASIALPSRWLSGSGVNANLTVLVTVKGDSMSPGIPDGAYVLVHLMEKAVKKPGVYAFNLDGQSFVKRLIPAETDSEGRPLAISIISDNPAFQPRVLTGSKLNDLKVVGRVRAVLSLL